MDELPERPHQPLPMASPAGKLPEIEEILERRMEAEENLAARKEKVERDLFILAWVGPIVSPLLYVTVTRMALFEYSKAFLSGLGLPGVGDKVGMFLIGWISLTIVCAGWIALRFSAIATGGMRVRMFLALWPLLLIGLGSAGLALSMAADRPQP